MKLCIQAQHLQPGDIVGSGEVVQRITINSTQWPSSKVCVTVSKNEKGSRSVFWGKYTTINAERKE